MLKIWGLVLFYGLFTQSSAHPRRHNLILTHPHAKAPVQAEASAQASLLEETATSLYSQLLKTNTPRNLKKLNILKALHTIGNSYAGVDAQFFGLDFASIKVLEAQIFYGNIIQNEDKHQLSATFPTVLDVEANINFLGNISFTIEMNNKFQIGAEMDENGDGYLVVQNCNTNLVKLQVKTTLFKTILNVFRSVLNAVVPPLVEKELCSAVSACLLNLRDKLKADLVNALICGSDLNAN